MQFYLRQCRKLDESLVSPARQAVEKLLVHKHAARLVCMAQELAQAKHPRDRWLRFKLIVEYLNDQLSSLQQSGCLETFRGGVLETEQYVLQTVSLPFCMSMYTSACLFQLLVSAPCLHAACCSWCCCTVQVHNSCNTHGLWMTKQRCRLLTLERTRDLPARGDVLVARELNNLGLKLKRVWFLLHGVQTAQQLQSAVERDAEVQECKLP